MLNRRAAEVWFRRRGLPSIVRGGVWRHLLVRAVPALVFLMLWDQLSELLAVLDGATDDEFDAMLSDDLRAFGYFSLVGAVFVVPPVAAWLANHWVRSRILGDTGRVAGTTVAAIFLAAIPISDNLLYGVEIGWDIGYQLTAFAMIVVLTALGTGSVFSWALRSTLRQLRTLGAVATRALPLLLLFSVLGFLTNEVWQMASLLSVSQIWWTVSLFALVAVLFQLSSIPNEIGSIADELDTRVGQAELDATPFRGHAISERAPMHWVERGNVVLVLMMTNLLQALFVGAVMFVFFIAFGWIAVKPELMKTWAGRDLTNGQLLGIQVALPQVLIHVSLFIAAFAALYFVVSTATDSLYRSQFFEPLTRHVAVSLAARDIYLTHVRKGWSTPTPCPTACTLS